VLDTVRVVMALVGRAGECATLREFLAAAHGDPGGTLVVAGAPGAGKTALVDHVVPAGAARVAGVEAEAGYPYAALHRLLIPFLDGADRAGELRVALGLADRPPAGPGSAARATAALLTAVGPVTCVVDDAHWADDASLDVLIRCAGTPGLALILVTGDVQRLAGLPVLEVGGLGEHDGIALLRAAATGPLDHAVATRLVAATGGSPRALTDLARELTTGRLLVGGRLAGHHLRQVPELPESVRLSAVDRGAGSDETAAAVLARIAVTRGSPARADLLTRAAELTRDAGDRARRMLDAAVAALDAGAPHQARQLADAAEREVPGGLTVRGRAQIVRAHALVVLGGENAYAEGPALCLEAATAPGLTRVALLEAVEHTLRAGDLATGAGPARIAAAIATRAPGSGGEVVERQLRAFTALVGGDPGTAVREIRRAAEALLGPDVPDEVVLRHHLTAATTSVLLWDAGLHRALWRRVADAARRTGAPWRLVVALYGATSVEVQLGDLDRAEYLLAETDRIRARIGATGEVWAIHRQPELIAWRSGTDGLEDGLRRALDAAVRLGSGSMRGLAEIGLVVLALGRGDYARARVAGRDVAGADALGLHSRALPDLVEAAVRSGDRMLAGRALDTLAGRANAAGTGWALGVLARSQALLAGPGTAEPLYRRAIELLDGTASRADLARAHLLYGEWLRRRKRRRDARAELRIARDLFDTMGAAGFAARAAQELTATGPTLRRGGGLTPQELAIATLAAGGATNGEIAAQLFLSANTVDHHLRQVFRKLGVTSRRRLPGSEILVNALKREDE
jgi:DNA-binding CsgD family transcriptional regulator